MANKQLFELPSGWQLKDKVQVVFPGNGTLQGTVVKVAFTEHSEPLYDVEIPFEHYDYEGEPGLNSSMPEKGFFRIHGLRQWFLSHTQEDWDKMQKEEGDSSRPDPEVYRLA